MSMSQKDIIDTFKGMAEAEQAALMVSLTSEMSVMSIVKAVKEMEEAFGVSAAAPVAIAAPAAGGAPAAAEEKQSFNVIMTNFGANKVGVIKVVREITGLGLKEAKDLVENVPATVKESLPKADAEKLVKALVEAGATAEIK